MPRTNITYVRSVLEFSEDITDISFYVDMATGLVDEVVDPDLPYDRLLQIETFLAAHFIAVFEVQSQQESAGSQQTTFRGQTGYALNSTLQGQQALLLDTSGGLATITAVAEAKKASPQTPASALATNGQAGVKWVGGVIE